MRYSVRKSIAKRVGQVNGRVGLAPENGAPGKTRAEIWGKAEDATPSRRKSSAHDSDGWAYGGDDPYDAETARERYLDSLNEDELSWLGLVLWARWRSKKAPTSAST